MLWREISKERNLEEFSEEVVPVQIAFSLSPLHPFYPPSIGHLLRQVFRSKKWYPITTITGARNPA